MPLNSMGRALDAAAGHFARGLRRSLLSELRAAAQLNELSLHYQPRVALPDGSPRGAEALLRWTNPFYGEVSPARFIPLAEASGLILPLGGWVLREATKEAASWPGGGILSVNVSARQVEAGVLEAQLDQALAESGLPPERLELELTESLALAESEEVRGTLARLRQRGVGLALDDFGTGHASLARLRRLPFSSVKLDRLFLGDLPRDAGNAAILRAVRQIASALRVKLVAEGVEQPEQRDFLTEIGCEEAQGWLFAYPMPAAALRDYWHRAALPSAAPRPMAGAAGAPSLATALPSR
ncbi:EAL domain-containing protein [Siccirubricoccus sp. KC 17139]|uniref:EAL domain-containing protein n=1 Tax=Siccirubricoccus soli TaxID=2899147 RepID=A0ABT1D4G3_9PROT|nr:EAL domain-containing protein [Siccirubricoccus soli]MCO6416817.1 EAL domain-containing protein [Siccirubricoccus soli]MCP2682952.1 EAL domain-containing protein [Siccirubricoccus soli]